MATPTVNPSPRARFQSIANNITQHRSLIEQPAFDRGADAALLEYAAALSRSNSNGNEAMASGFKLQGAMEFLMMFKTIAEQAPIMSRPKDPDNLPDLNNLKRQ